MTPRERRAAELVKARDRINAELSRMYLTPKPKQPRTTTTTPKSSEAKELERREAELVRADAETHRQRALNRWGYTPTQQAHHLAQVNADAALWVDYKKRPSPNARRRAA